MTARQWLRKNGYEDIAEVIDEILLEWKESGNGTRRNWWDILAGGKNGKPRTISGRKLPVLRAAQLRQGRPITKNAIFRNSEEEFPPKLFTGRWIQNDNQ